MRRESDYTFKSVLAVAGIVIVVLQIAAAVPLHILAYAGVEIAPGAMIMVTFGFMLELIMMLPITVVLFSGQFARLRAKQTALRNHFGRLGWMWSRGYWNEHVKLLSPFAPAWLRWLGLLIIPYSLTIHLLNLYFLLTSMGTDLPGMRYGTLVISTMGLQMSVYLLPMLVSTVRERRMQSEQASQV